MASRLKSLELQLGVLLLDLFAIELLDYIHLGSQFVILALQDLRASQLLRFVEDALAVRVEL